MFYSTGPAKAATLEILNYCGILVLIYFLGYVLLALEYAGKPQQGAFQFIFAFGLIGSILIICLVNLKLSPYIAFIWTTVIILYAIAFDYYNYADTRQKDMLYVQLYIYAWLIFVATIFFVLHLPERCCPRTRFAYYFLSGKVWLQITVIIFLWVLYWAFINTIKLHDGSFDNPQPVAAAAPPPPAEG